MTICPNSLNLGLKLKMFPEISELFMISNPESWVGASQAELVEHGLGCIISSKGILKV